MFALSSRLIGSRFRSSPVVSEAFSLVKLGAPLSVAHLSYLATISTDVLMMGWLGADALATGSLAWHLYGFFDFFVLGVLCAVSPILSQHLGAARTRHVRPGVRAGIWLAALMTLPCMLILWQAGALLELLGQSSTLADDAQSYLRYMMIGMLPALWLFVISEFLATLHRTRTLLVVSVAGIGLNGLANYALMFGNFGFPALGLDGAGISTAVVNICMFLALFTFALADRRLRRYHLLRQIWRFDGARILELLKLGLPIGGTEMAEMGMFLTVTLFMGWISTEALAANAVAGQYCAISFAITIGLAQAATIRVGRSVGAGNMDKTALSGWTAVGLGAAISLLPAFAFWFYGDALAGLFLDVGDQANSDVIKLAVAILAIGALFQLADTVQGISIGALRGLKDTTAPMLITLVCYWGLALPVAGLLGFGLQMGATGIWIGLVTGLSAAGILLAGRFWTICRTHQAGGV